MIKVNQSFFTKFNWFQQLNNHKGWRFFKLFVILLFFNFISVLITSKLLISAHIYIPGIYWIPQTIAYKVSSASIEGEWMGKNIISLELFVYYFGCSILNLPLIIFAYYKIGHRYAKYSALSIGIWISLGIILAIIEKRIEVSHVNEPEKLKESFFRWFDFDEQLNIDGTSLERTHEISFYLLALVIGLFDGLVSSFIWKQKLCSGGLDFVFTYVTIKQRKQVNQVSLLLSIVFSMMAILINETSNDKFNLTNFIFLLIASTILVYSRLTVIGFLYPKYKLITFLIVTQKGQDMREKLLTFYRHGGNLIKVKGLYDNREKLMIITTMTYLEKDFLLHELLRFDKKAFIIGLPSNFISSSFHYEG